ISRTKRPSAPSPRMARLSFAESLALASVSPGHSSRMSAAATSQRLENACAARSPSVDAAMASAAMATGAGTATSPPSTATAHASARIVTRARRGAPTCLAQQAIGDLRHLFARLHGLRVDLVCAQRGDHVDHLLHDLDVARLERALYQPAEAVLLRESELRLARR